MFRIASRGFAAFSFLACLVCAGSALAQAFPAKPLRIIVSFPPGASLDLSARTLAQRVSENIGQQVLVDNRAGGNTIVSADVAAHSPADGYTLFLALDTTFTVVPLLYARLPFDPVKDFAPITQASSAAYLFAASPRVPFRTMPELVAYAKANPGKLNFGASTVLTQALTVLLKSSAGVDVTYVPYKGTPPMIQALMTGEVDVVVDAIPLYLPLLKQGKALAIAATSSARAVQLPDVITMREAGFPQLEADSFTGLFAPAGTPEPVIAKLNAEFTRVLNDAGFRQKILDAGLNAAASSTPEKLGAMVRDGLAKWGPVIKSAGIKLD
jgi:tripartite-type tricarboxylate transporter receptor subunit TctC